MQPHRKIDESFKIIIQLFAANLHTATCHGSIFAHVQH